MWSLKHLALIISEDIERLAALNSAAVATDFTVNCIGSLNIARDLIARYSNDYHLILIDGDSLGSETNARTFLRGVQGNAPKSNTVIFTAAPASFAAFEPVVQVCTLEEAIERMPRFKRDVMRFRSGPVKKPRRISPPVREPSE